jgi:hypothetical protein
VTIASTPDEIAFFQMCSRRGALRMEIVGMRRSRGRTAYSIIKEVYGLKGSRESVLEQLNKMIEDCIRAKQAQKGKENE